MRPLRSHNHPFGCQPKADKDYYFKMDNGENEHQLSRRVSLDTKAKDELHMVEAEVMNHRAVKLK